MHPWVLTRASLGPASDPGWGCCAQCQLRVAVGMKALRAQAAACKAWMARLFPRGKSQPRHPDPTRTKASTCSQNQCRLLWEMPRGWGNRGSHSPPSTLGQSPDPRERAVAGLGGGGGGGRPGQGRWSLGPGRTGHGLSVGVQGGAGERRSRGQPSGLPSSSSS